MTKSEDESTSAKGSAVVVTGYGVVSPIGVGLTAFETSLAEKRSGVARIIGFDSHRLPAPLAAEVRGFEAKEYVRPRKSLKVMSRDIQFGFAAAVMAIGHAGLDSTSLSSDRFGVVLGGDMMYCDLPEAAAAFRSCMVDGQMDFSRWGDHAIGELNPLWLLKYLPNMPACHVAIALDARGPNNTIVDGDTSSLAAIAEAASVIDRGLADVMLAGGTSARIHPSVFAFRGDQHMSHRGRDPSSVPRPFDVDRDGVVYGEGAAVLVLESHDHARARKARNLASIKGYASCFEPVTRNSLNLKRGVAGSIQTALKRANLTADQIGHVNANGLATQTHDVAEATAIADALGDCPVTAPKSFFGNLEGAAGAAEAVVSLVALESGQVPVTLNHDQTDPRCPIRIVHGESVDQRYPSAMLLNQDVHGQCAAMILTRDP